MIQQRYRTLSSPDTDYVLSCFDEFSSSAEVLMTQTICNFTITRGFLSCLRSSHCITADMISVIFELFQQRDNRVSEAHRDVNANSGSRGSYEERRFSVYSTKPLGSRQYFDVESGMLDLRSIHELFTNWKIKHRIYLPVHSREEYDKWFLFVIDVPKKSIFFLDPHFDRQNPVESPETMALREEYGVAINNCLRQTNDEGLLADDWPCIQYGNPQSGFADAVAYEPLQDGFDSGMYIVTFTDFLSFDLPIIFHCADMYEFRISLAYNILKKEISF